jgi:hypothetical protein
VYERQKLVGIERGPALADREVDVVAREIDTVLLADHGTYVDRSVIFSYEPIVGWWGRGDSWRIVPAPPEAPRPNVTYAKHPALLEIRVPETTDHFIRSGRAWRARHPVRLLVALLLHGEIAWPSGTGLHEWVLVYDQGSEPRSVWAQLDYMIPTFNPVATDFSDVADWEPLQEIDPDEYFARIGVGSEALTAPRNLSGYLDAFDQLTADEQDDFMRACHLRHLAADPQVATVLRFTALVSAIETLADKAASPTRRFQEFMQHHAPGLEGPRDLYGLRSELSHGDRLLFGDIPGGGFGVLHPTSVVEQTRIMALAWAVRIALVNWLAEKGSAGKIKPTGPAEWPLHELRSASRRVS